ncbi:hypothetical protein AJ79_06597 [Helicocarpus griseus UAMH5409]|uniref:Uncharacterized protein n=1 Tax=Helicocarpus griseus UAMH5409 TaxID=1447875 RepID=A0A2B7XBE2_9EURO|nr:hypothetical protein AJ79_06597 [Helicocarpus griseus UAMH5409]
MTAAVKLIWLAGTIEEEAMRNVRSMKRISKLVTDEDEVEVEDTDNQKGKEADKLGNQIHG